MENPTWGDVIDETVIGDDLPEGDVIQVDDDEEIEVIEVEVVNQEIVLPEMGEDEAKQITNWIRTSAEMLEVLLFRAREGKAYKALGYESWDDYTQNEFGISGSTGYRKSIVGEVALEIESASGVLPKLSQKEAKEIRSILPEITEKIEKKKEEEQVEALSEDEIESLLADARSALSQISEIEVPENIPSVKPEGSADDLAERMASLDSSIFADGNPLENSASGLDTGAGSIGEARREAQAQHRADAMGAPEFDASNLSLEDIAAIRGRSLTPANSVRAFVEWDKKLPDPLEVAQIFRDDSIDDEFTENLPNVLRGISNWIDRFLKEYEKDTE